MVNYNSKDMVYSGVPLGGIGTGKIEINPDGTFGSITLRNNWTNPLGYRNPKNKTSHTEHVPGFHLAIRTDSAATLLQNIPLNNYPTTKRIHYKGEYPFTKVTYYPKNIPIIVTLEAFSPLILGDAGNSSHPGILINFELKNKLKKRTKLSLLFILRNIIGNYPTGRYNLLKKAPSSRTIVFTQNNPYEYDHTYGSMLFTVHSSWGRFTCQDSWNMCSQNFKFDASNMLFPFWQTWSETGELPDTSNKIKVSSGSHELGAAINVSGTIKAGGRVQVKALLAWNFPRHPFSPSPLPMGNGEGKGKGTEAQSLERKATAITHRLLKNASNLRTETLKWQYTIKESSLPDWLADALINNLYVLTSGSIQTPDGKFALYEAPVECPYLGTLDVRFYGSLPLALFFPELEKSELMQLAQAQRPDGYIPHDFGWNRMDSPNDGTTMLKWKDLCPKFILMVDRYWQWHKDSKLLADMYPVCKRAMLWEFNCDKNNDSLPDNEGADQTFDLWQFYGANSYTSSIYLASLLAMAKMATHVGDDKFAQKIRQIFSLAQRNFISSLWNKNYFIAANDSLNKKVDLACTANQLMGQWFSHMLNLGHIVPQWYIKKALKTVFKYNAAMSRYGAVNSVRSINSKVHGTHGNVDTSNYHASNIWPGISYALSALAIYEGMTTDGLVLAKKVWDNIVHNQKSPWNQPDVIDARSGAFGFGDHYMRNMVIWAVPLALARYDEKINNMFVKLTQK